MSKYHCGKQPPLDIALNDRSMNVVAPSCDNWLSWYSMGTIRGGGCFLNFCQIVLLHVSACSWLHNCRWRVELPVLSCLLFVNKVRARTAIITRFDSHPTQPPMMSAVLSVHTMSGIHSWKSLSVEQKDNVFPSFILIYRLMDCSLHYAQNVWLIAGTVYLHFVLIPALLTLSRRVYLLSWNQKLCIRYCIVLIIY